MKKRRFGAIRQLPSKRWQARWSLHDGSMVAADRTFATRAEADRYLAEHELRLQVGARRDPRAGNVTLKEWSERWLESSTHLKPKSRVGYESLLRSTILPTFGRRRLRDIESLEVREWAASLSRRGLSPSRVRQSYRLLSQLCDAAVTGGVLHASPCVGVKLPRLPDVEPVILTPVQVKALAEQMRPPYGLLTRTLAYTGLRFGEAAGLQRRRIDLARQRLIVAASLSDAAGVLTLEEPKSHQRRLVTLPAFLHAEMATHLALTTGPPDALVFTSPDGLPMRNGNFLTRVWRPACVIVGIDATPHDLRATHATWLYDQGWSPVEIAARLGHSRATVTTKHYARSVVGRDVEIAARLDELALAEEAVDS